ncbi:trypsin-like peptidase domain-containing protein [Streptomyces violens]|uniref:VMAP-C domain-containing protein n=1 Tax=Streptomyces violens TaxID=66377 RepID=UPI00068E40FE|nr:trypsin-like peptidase domain-containing protein [Streptomyces violens]
MTGAHDPDAYFSRRFAPLVKAATVRIHAARDGYPHGGQSEPPLWGSGFFVAPNWVLTCAHVALEGEGGEVGVSFEGGSARGRVEWAEPAVRTDGLLPAPDLALIRLLQPTAHPCCWLSPRTVRAHGGERVAYFGYTEIAGTVGAFDGRCTVRGEFGGEGLLRLGNEDEMPEGLSGGPLVDVERGEVIGVLKGRRGGARDGGLGIALAQLRRIGVPGTPIGREEDDPYHRVLHAHDRYHADRHADVSEARDTWTEAQSGLPASAATVAALTPKRRVVLHGLLAQLPPPAGTPALVALVDELLPRRGEGLSPAPRGWREGLEVYLDRLELRDEHSELEAVLRYAVYAATAEHPYPATTEAADAVWDWVRDLAMTELPPLARNRLGAEWHARVRARAVGRGRRTGEHAAAGGPLPSVLLEITERAWEQGRFDWYLTASRPSGDLPLGEGRHGTALADLPAELAGPLGEAFRRSDEPGRPAVLEVALRQALLDLDVDTWRIPPGSRPIGELRPVVVRCADRPPGPACGEGDGTDPGTGPQERWTRLHEDGMEHTCVDCDEGRPEEVTADLLRELGPRSFPVLCRVPGGDGGAATIRRIVGSGHPVALWRRERMDPVCGEYHRGILRTVKSGTTAHRLPLAVRELRAGIGAAEPEAYWSRGITLLYDDPGRPLPGADDVLETP